MGEFERVRVQSARKEWRHFLLYVHSSLLPSPFHFPHRLIKRYSLMMMMMKEIFVFIRALSQADLIFLFGARLNWILHFGKPPRFKADVKIVQVLYRHSWTSCYPKYQFQIFLYHSQTFFFLQNVFLVKKDKWNKTRRGHKREKWKKSSYERIRELKQWQRLQWRERQKCNRFD